MNANNRLRHVIVLGGGTAGWLAACHLAKKLHPKKTGGVRITVIESPTIPTIGVGEGTVPMMRQTLKYFGISETEFFRQCEVTFKQSIKFINWENTQSSYHHLFDFPAITDIDLTPYWLNGINRDRSYAETVAIQSAICDAGLAPKTLVHAEYEGNTHYAYHLNAGKFGQLLARHACESLGVDHQYADIVDATLNEYGHIVSILDGKGELHCADFFVDCSGFDSVLLGKQLGSKFIDRSNTLFVDHAVVAQVPYPNELAPIACSTLAAAQSAGWIWDIGLTTRRGLGHVYSSRHCTHDEAEQTLRDYIGASNQNISTRRIAMKIGYRETFWAKNCAAIGLAQGFVEPLEATGLLVFDVSSRMLAELLPFRLDQLSNSAAQFNRTMTFAWERVTDFIKLHYCISKRDDSAFWQDNKDPGTIPDNLQELLARWRYRCPSHYDFSNINSIFNLENYLYVLYGMNYPTDLSASLVRYEDHSKALKLAQMIDERKNQLLRSLKPHRDVINKICLHGLQKI